MPNSISGSSVVSGLANDLTYHVNGRTARRIDAMGNQTALDVAAVRSTAIVRSAQLKEIDRLARDAMTGQVLLQKWGTALASGDPFVGDDIKTFIDIAKVAKAEVLVNVAKDFCQGGLR